MRILHVGDDFAALRPCGLTLYSDALMQAQAAAGHAVAYVFSGRHYPRLRQPRLKRWRDRGVSMYELVGSPIHTHWEKGTREPGLDLHEAAGEAAFAAALREARPDVVHIQELMRLPSSLIELARGAGVPVVMTLHDYKSVCAAVRLLDADGCRCTRIDVGEDCARNCAGAPAGPAHLIQRTVDWEVDRATKRLKRAVPLAGMIDFTFAGPALDATRRLAMARSNGGGGAPAPSDAAPAAALPPDPAMYQRRRDVNLTRLDTCDRLVAPSQRVADIYASLGVRTDRMVVQRLTLPHLATIAAPPARSPGTPLVFATLGGCASRSKGSGVLIEAVQALERSGHGGSYRLLVLGGVDEHTRQAFANVESVSLLGPYAPQDLDALLEPADVGLMPSVWEEVHGFVGIEMLAKGLPLIGNALGGIPEYVVEGETGWLNRSATGAELAELMARLLADRADVERLRESVRARRATIVRPMAEHAAEVEAMYADVVGATAPAPPAAG